MSKVTTIPPASCAIGFLYFVALETTNRKYKKPPNIISKHSSTILISGIFHSPNPSKGRFPKFPGNSGKSMRCTSKSKIQ